MLVELKLVEQRYRAVIDVLDGMSVTDVARRNGVTRQTRPRVAAPLCQRGPGRTWPTRARSPRAARTRCPRSSRRGWSSCAGRTPLGTAIDPHPARQGGVDSSARTLVDLSDPRPPPPHRADASESGDASDYKRWERSRSMELWQMDVVGRFYLDDGTEGKMVTGIDDHSRFCVCARVVARATARPVCEALQCVLDGYRYLEGGLSDVGTFHPPTGPGTPVLKTAIGATLGMTLIEVRPLYPAGAFSEVQGEPSSFLEPRRARGCSGFFSTSPTTPLTEIKGGSTCGDV